QKRPDRRFERCVPVYLHERSSCLHNYETRLRPRARAKKDAKDAKDTKISVLGVLGVLGSSSLLTVAAGCNQAGTQSKRRTPAQILMGRCWHVGSAEDQQTLHNRMVLFTRQKELLAQRLAFIQNRAEDGVFIGHEN